MTIFAALALAVSLAITPTSGPAPLTLHMTVKVSGPFQGLACVTVAHKGQDDAALMNCEPVEVAAGASASVKFEPSGGESGKDYDFRAILFAFDAKGEVDTDAPAATSDPVTVSVK